MGIQRPSIPALLNATSKRPNFYTVLWMSASTWAAFDTSTFTNNAITSGGTDQLDGLFSFYFPAARDHHFGSRLREKYGGISTDTRRPAGHEPNLAFQFCCHNFPFSNQVIQDGTPECRLRMKPASNGYTSPTNKSQLIDHPGRHTFPAESFLGCPRRRNVKFGQLTGKERVLRECRDELGKLRASHFWFFLTQRS